MPVGQISQLETGVRSDPAFSTVARLARALRVSMDAVAHACGLLDEGPELASVLAPSARARAKLQTGIEDAVGEARRLAESLESLAGLGPKAKRKPARRR